MRAVIMAGGKGTRLSTITRDEFPKPMAIVAGKPILEWQIKTLKENNITHIIIIIGYLGEKIKNYFGDGSAFGVSLQYFEETQPLGTAGALYYANNYLDDSDFLLVYGDVIFDIYIKKMFKFHEQKKAVATLFAHPNSHPYDSDLLVVDENDRITQFNSKQNKRNYWYDNCVNAGIYILSRHICELIPPDTKTDLEKDILYKLCENKASIYAYRSPEYVKDVGTPDRIKEAEQDILSGLVAARNLTNRQKCIFFDRDGTLNEHRGLIYNVDDLVLEENAAEAVGKVNKSGFLAIVVSNQPVVARGLCSVSDVDKINNKMKTLLGNSGVYLDAVMVCPHHPDKGYPEENPTYKIMCKCRKPGTGMVDECAEKYNIDLSQSWIIGDTTSDILTGRNAGLGTVLVMTGMGGKDRKYDVYPDIIAANVLEAVRKLF